MLTSPGPNPLGRSLCDQEPAGDLQRIAQAVEEIGGGTIAVGMAPLKMSLRFCYASRKIEGNYL
jgi:hypothetical protein